MTLTANPPSQYLIDLVGALGGEWHGHKAICRCPAHSDNGPSLSIRQGDRDILVYCFAGCHPADILRELANINVNRRYEAPPAVKNTGTANIERLWNAAQDVRETIAERYLASRFLLPVPLDVRFHPRCPLGPSPHTVFKPALLVAIREGVSLVAVQRIFLKPDGTGYTEKRTLGTIGAGAWRGGGVGPKTGLAEGFESGRAWSLLRGIPCWSPMGSKRLDLVTIPNGVTHLYAAVDNDLAGRRAAQRAMERYSTPTRTVIPDFPPKGFKDWAEVLEAKEGGGREG